MKTLYQVLIKSICENSLSHSVYCIAATDEEDAKTKALNELAERAPNSAICNTTISKIEPEKIEQVCIFNHLERCFALPAKRRRSRK